MVNTPPPTQHAPSKRKKEKKEKIVLWNSVPFFIRQNKWLGPRTWVPFSKVQPRVGPYQHRPGETLPHVTRACEDFTRTIPKTPTTPSFIHKNNNKYINISLCSFSFAKTCNSSKCSGSGSRKRLRRCRSVVLCSLFVFVYVFFWFVRVL
jgi:hypothetical protein